MDFALCAEEVTRACGEYIQRREGFVGTYLIKARYQVMNEMVVFVSFTKITGEDNEKVDEGSTRGSQSQGEGTLGRSEET